MNSPEPPASSRRSLVRQSLARVLEAVAVWAIVAGAIGWLTWKELSRKPELRVVGRSLVLLAPSAGGILKKSPLVCQGVIVGRIERVTPVPEAGGKLEIRLEATLEGKFDDWKFAPTARIGSGGVTGAITGVPVELDFEGLLTPQELENLRAQPQNLQVVVPETATDRLDRLLASTEVIVSSFSDPASPEQIPTQWTGLPSPSRIEIIAVNLLEATADLKSATAKLDREMDRSDQQAVMASLHAMRGDFTEITTEASDLLKTMRTSMDQFDTKMGDVIGKSAEERSRTRQQVAQTLEAMHSLVQRIEGLTQRTGDTFLGRMLIRKAEKPKEAATPNRQPPR